MQEHIHRSTCCQALTPNTFLEMTRGDVAQVHALGGRGRRVTRGGRRASAAFGPRHTVA